MKPVQVMIVEDEAIVSIDIRENLINFGYQVVGISSSGEDTIKNALKNRPEIILMDIELEGEMNGIETARQIKSQLDIPVIYLTSFSDDTMLAKALETEPSGYLLKPFFARELHTSIQTAINKSAIEKEFKRDRKNHIPKNLETLLGDLIFSQNTDKTIPYFFPLEELAIPLGYTKDEVERMANLIIPLLIHGEDFILIENYFRQIITNPGQKSEVELRLKHKSGVYRWFQLTGIFHSIDKEHGKVIHSAKDITWVKNLEYTSHISREKLTAISNNPYFGIAILDMNAKILNMNPTIETLTGYSKEDLNWLHFSDFIGAKELKSICENFEKLKQGKLETFQAEVLIKPQFGGTLWGYMVFNAIYNQEKIIDRVVCTLVDISESKLFRKQSI